MRRLAFVTTDFPPMPGGIARLCSEVARGVARRGWAVTVLAPGAPGCELVDGTGEPPVIRVAGRGPALYLRMAYRLRRLGPIDVVLCGAWYPDAAVVLGARTGRPLAVWAHGSELYDWGGRGIRGALRVAHRRLRTSVLQRADVVLANSAFTRDLVLSRAPQCRRAEVIPLGTDPAVFRPDLDATDLRGALGFGDERVLLSVGRVVEYKGYNTIVQALRLMPDRERIRYVVVGDGPYRSDLEQLCERLAVRHLVHFAGHVRDDALPSYYALADVFVLCTEERVGDVEGFGIVFLEAAASGLPTIGTRAGGIPDAVADGETGILVEPGDAPSVASAIGFLLRDTESARRMGESGRARVLERFNWDVTSSITAQHLASLCAPPPAGGGRVTGRAPRVGGTHP